ncbi:EAL domain-containing protein [Pontibacterium granulatum]|uniref:EAL domain-containing protein n=1 Tax=Pontibacterium granulatum TaxID=2036029 RepID=UPI00249CC033|nr:EAL domain-containing protein [Pontibacterium granulatum]MDI3326413.1 EAL domain-containing protein [Pontibacterium granulatum]
MTPPAVYVLGFILLLSFVTGAYFTEKFIYERHAIQVRSEVQQHLYTTRDRIDNNLKGDMQLARGLIAAIAADPYMDQLTFEQAAEALMEKNQRLKEMSAAPGLVIKFLYPIAGNEGALNLDLAKVPEQFGAIQRARSTGEMVLSGPVDLIEGGTAFISRMPVFLSDEGGPYFWGIASALIDEHALYMNSGLLNDDMPIEIAIRGKDALGPEGEVFFGRASLFDEHPVLTEILLPNGSWQLAAVAKGEQALPGVIWLIRGGFALLALVILLAFVAIVNSLRQAHLAQAQLSLSLRALHEREALLRTVVDEMPDVVVLKDKDGKFLLGNQAVAQLYNTTPDEMLGKDDADFGVPKEMADFFRENIQAVIARGETEVVFEDSTDAVTGEVRHFKSIKRPFKDVDGNDQILVIAHDITDIVDAQDQVAANEAKLSAILDNVDAYIYLKDSDGKYLFANKKVLDLWGVSMDEVIGYTDDQFFDAESVVIIKQNDRQVFETGETFREEESATNLRDGSVGIYRTTKLPLRRDDGSIYALCGISVDISEIKRIEHALRESEQRFKVAGKAAYDLIYEWEVATDSLRWFGDIDRILGCKPGEISHEVDSWLALIHPDDRPRLAGVVEQHRNSIQPINYEYRIRHNNGTYRYWSDHALPLLDDNRKPYKWIGVCTDITTQKQQQRELEFSAYHDRLTSLPNRMLLSDRLRQAMYQEARRGQSLAVVYIDLDGFKEINDTHGHEMGDHLLVAIAKRFQRVLREGDTVARLGGDEFVAVLIDIETTASAIPLLRRLLKVIGEPVLVDDLILHVSASIGVSFYPQNDDVDADQLLRQADQAMYQAKLEGKNRYHFFDAEHDRSLRGQHEILERIGEALLRNEFELYYQPKVNMRTGQVLGVEALIRWNHPVEGHLQPGEFLPVIEDHPLSIELGEWVINQALKQLQCWSRMGLNIPVSVNIGGLQLQQSNFAEQLQRLLAQYPDVEPADLELEVLETCALQDIVKVSKVMRACQLIGVNFSLDDFGTGYSSLTYLKSLPAAVLKIDRSFVRDMLEDPDDLAILEGVVGMAAAFRRKVIAEGVECVEHGKLLLQLGCELAQGYAIAKPMPASEVPQWIESWQPPKEWRTQKPISRDDLSLLFAAIEHKAWMRTLDYYLSGDVEQTPPLAPDTCRFGQWLDTEGKRRYGGTALFSEVIELHRQVHLTGQDICRLYEANEVLAAQAKLDDLTDLSDDLLSCLDVLLSGYSLERLNVVSD